MACTDPWPPSCHVSHLLRAVQTDRQTSVPYTSKHCHIWYDDIQLPYMHAVPKRVSAHYKLLTEFGTVLCFAHTSLSAKSAK